MISTANGTLEFDFYYTSDITANITSNTAIYTTVMQYRDELSKIVGNKQIVINNSDNTSRAEGSINFIETSTTVNNDFETRDPWIYHEY